MYLKNLSVSNVAMIAFLLSPKLEIPNVIVQLQVIGLFCPGSLNFYQNREMELRKTVQEILKGSPDDRIDEVTELLNIEGVETADDLKYFDWNSLHAFGKLTKMEVNKIMRYIQEKFPDEYKEHKRKMDEGRKIQNETEILKFNVGLEKFLQQEKIKLEEEKVKKLKEQQEIEEESRSLQNQHKGNKVNVLADLKKIKWEQIEDKEFEEIMKFMEEVKQKRTMKAEDVEMQEKQSSFQVAGEDSSNNIENLRNMKTPATEPTKKM